MRLSLLAIVLSLAACNTGGGSQKSEVLGAAPEAAAVAPHELAAAAAAATSNGPAVAQLTRIRDSSEVCMVNNHYMGTKQIPVVVDGKTYYGCCDMCKDRLARDATTRFGKDPVSGKDVDKAAAVIAKRENGQVLYFESAENLERYRSM